MGNNFISNFCLRFRNAKKVIKQIKKGEWVPVINHSDRCCYLAQRDGRMLWLANGAFFCDLIDPENYEKLSAFGLIFRHWVWWGTARKLKKEADKKLQVKTLPKL